jgi:hypothetical protein
VCDDIRRGRRTEIQAKTLQASLVRCMGSGYKNKSPMNFVVENDSHWIMMR